MKVIVIKNCDIGKTGDVKEVKAGYARNFLLPQDLVVQATAVNLEIWQTKLAAKNELKAVQKESKDMLVEKLSNEKLVIEAKANEQGNLYASVSDKNIVKAIKEQLNIDLSKRPVKLLSTIKKIGESKTQIQVGSQKIDLIININAKQKNKKN